MKPTYPRGAKSAYPTLFSALKTYNASQLKLSKSKAKLKEEILLARDSGVTELSLAQWTGLSRTTVRSWLGKNSPPE